MFASLTSDVSTRYYLTEVARGLYEHNTERTHRSIEQLSLVSPSLVQRIYFKTWEAAGSPTPTTHPDTAHEDFGRLAFFNLEGRALPLPKKVEIVETILSDVIEEERYARQETSLSSPLRGERVKLNCFYDCGFDPRFSEDGNLYLTPSSNPFFRLLTTIQKTVARIFFNLNAYFSCNREERTLRQLILSCEQLELQCSRYAYDAHVKASSNSRSISLFPKAEHAFFEKVSDLFKALHPHETHPPRVFPSELLHAIHTINKPQKEEWDAERARPYPWENGDLNRSMRWGLHRLSAHLYTGIDRLEQGYVPHYIFLHAIKESSNELKQACRSLRTALTETSSDIKSALSWKVCKQKITPHIDKLKQCWDQYVQSHELVAEQQLLFSQKDYYAKEYKVYEWESYIPSCLMQNYREYCSSRYGSSHYFSTQAQQEGFDSLKNALQGPFRETLTGRFLTLLQPEEQARA